MKEINRRSGAHVEIDKSQRQSSDGADKMFCIKGTNEQIQYAQQLIYEKITGVQGSQPPTGYFQNPNEAAGGGGDYGQSQAAAMAAGYGQQAWANQYAQYADPSKTAADPNAAAWAAYYQQYYGAAAPAATPAAAGGAPAAPAAGATPAAAAAGSQPAINPQTGQPDYSQAWVEYYRSLGMHDQAEAILRQTQTGQAANGGAPAAATNGAGSAAPSNGQQPQQQQQQQQPQQHQQSQQQNGGGGGQGANWQGGYSGYQNYGNYYKQDAGNA